MKVLLLLLGLATLPLAAQDLWNGTKAGMSETEVRSVIPEVKIQEKDSELATGTKEKLWLPEVKIQGEIFSAHFYFLGGKLDQVMLTLKNEKRSFEALAPVFDSLTAAFQKEHGKPTETKRDGNVAMKMWINNWDTKHRRLNLIIFGTTGSEAILNINYQDSPLD